MTHDQKKLLHAVGALIVFKAVLLASMHYAAKTAREATIRQEKMVSS